MRSGYGGRTRGVFPIVWTPLVLFTPGTLGAWYDVSDLSSLFQDAAGTVAAVVDQPVGRINDKSGNGNHLSQATSGLRPTLRLSGGKYYLQFTGGGQVLTGASNSAFKFMHLFANGAHAAVGARAGIVADPNAAYALMGTGAATGGSYGFTLFHDTRDSIRDRQLALIVGAGGGTAVYDGATAAGTAAANTDLSFAISLAPNAVSTPATLYIENASSATISRTAAPVNANSTYPFQLGAGGNSAISFVGRFYQAVLYDRQATTDERNNLESWVQGKMP